MYIDTHKDAAATIESFVRVVRSMRYADVVKIADTLELLRRSGADKKSARSLTADDFIALCDDGCLVDGDVA